MSRPIAFDPRTHRAKPGRGAMEFFGKVRLMRVGRIMPAAVRRIALMLMGLRVRLDVRLGCRRSTDLVRSAVGMNSTCRSLEGFTGSAELGYIFVQTVLTAKINGPFVILKPVRRRLIDFHLADWVDWHSDLSWVQKDERLGYRFFFVQYRWRKTNIRMVIVLPNPGTNLDAPSPPKLHVR